MHSRALARSAVFLCAALLASAQQPGTISGKITDPSGGSVAGAEIAAKPSSGGPATNAASDNSGRFAIPNLTPGIYELTVKKTGFDASVTTVNLFAGATLDEAIHLTLGARQETTEVDAKLSAVPTETPTGQTLFTISQDEFRNTPAFTVTDIFDLTPGVTTAQGNGPRDISISVRGSNERQTYGVRNIQMSEDGFPITQPDGLGRTDLSDPHGYGGADVVEGPSSALYGNDATGGAINFHTRQTQGVEVGTDFGSFGYANDYLNLGSSGDNYRVSALISNVRGSQYTDHTNYNTFTANILASYSITKKDRVTFKFIDNELATQLSIRLSLNQYKANPWQIGCSALAGTACASVSLYANGYNGVKDLLSADQAGLGRHDRRTIVGARWEHDITANTTWRTQFVFDDRDINQPTSSTSAIGPYPSFNFMTDLTRHGLLFGRQSTTYVAASFNYENFKSLTYNVAPGGNATLGGLTQTVLGTDWNGAIRIRQEIALANRWTFIAGAGLERSGLAATEDNYTYPTNATPAITNIPANRGYLNFAPDAAVRFQALQKLALHSHLGTGYGTPQATNLFVTPAGVFGNNTQLKTQKNVGIDFGVDWTPGAFLKLSASAFQEWFHNELVTQSPGVNLQSYTFNAPSSSHKGVEGVAEIRPHIPGLRLRGSYLFDRQIYTNYFETLSSGKFSSTFDRDGNLIPGVTPQFFNVRVIYDQAKGHLRGFGAFAEEDIRSSFFLDNANLLRAPGSNLLNLEVHYTPPAEHGLWSRVNFYAEVRNLTSKAYVASASNITDSLNTTTGAENGVSTLATSGVIWAGEPRAIFGGIRIKIFR